LISFIDKHISGSSLKARFLRGNVVLGAGTAVEKVLALASKILLARLLLPEELGVIVLIVGITGLFECLTEVGIKQSIIQNKNGATPEYLNVGWWFQAIRSIGLFALAWVLTPLVCEFYFEGKEEILARYDWSTLHTMVRVAFLSIVCNGLVSPRAYALEKEFRFGKVVLYVQGSTAVGTILTILLTLWFRNAWAMVWGFVCQAMLRTLMSYWIAPFRPTLLFQKESFLDICRFARGILGMPVLTYFAYTLDVLVGGKMVSTDLIGMYGFVVVLARVPRELFGRIVWPALLPVIAERQADHEGIIRVILRLTRVIALVGLPAVVTAFAFGSQLVTVVYGQKFETMGAVFSLYALNVYFLIQTMVLAGVLIGLGKPEKQRFYIAVRVLLIALLLVPCIRYWSMNGAARLLAAASGLTVIALLSAVRKQIGLSCAEYVKTWGHGMILSVGFMAVFGMLKHLIE